MTGRLITLDEYWMGRDKTHKSDLTPVIIANATRTVAAANKLLAIIAQSWDVDLDIHPVNKSLVSSGWRPPAINAGVPGAAVRSKHMTGDAVDIYDPDGDIDEWCLDNLKQLESCGIWLEHPAATKGWSHWQTIPPRSKNRVFYP